MALSADEIIASLASLGDDYNRTVQGLIPAPPPQVAPTPAPAPQADPAQESWQRSMQMLVGFLGNQRNPMNATISATKIPYGVNRQDSQMVRDVDAQRNAARLEQQRLMAVQQVQEAESRRADQQLKMQQQAYDLNTRRFNEIDVPAAARAAQEPTGYERLRLQAQLDALEQGYRTQTGLRGAQFDQALRQPELDRQYAIDQARLGLERQRVGLEGQRVAQAGASAANDVTEATMRWGADTVIDSYNKAIANWEAANLMPATGAVKVQIADELRRQLYPVLATVVGPERTLSLLNSLSVSASSEPEPEPVDQERARQDNLSRSQAIQNADSSYGNHIQSLTPTPATPSHFMVPVSEEDRRNRERMVNGR